MQTSSATSFDKPKTFNGVFTAIVTPFLSSGDLDWKTYEQLIDQQLTAGIHGIVPCGTTGESPTLSTEEKRKLYEITVAKCRGRALVLAGTGSNSTKKTMEDTNLACIAGVDAVLVVTPYYNKPSQDGLLAHYRHVADASSVPVILYNVPGRTGVSLTAGTVAKLAEHARIIGIKEATGNIALLSEIRTAVTTQIGTKKPFYFLSGDDVTFWPFMASGGHGIISVASNVLPNSMRMLYEDWVEGRIGSGLALFERLSGLFSALFVESNPVPVKTLMGWRGTLTTAFRLPLTAMAAANAEKLKAAWDQLLPHLKNDHPREDLHG